MKQLYNFFLKNHTKFINEFLGSQWINDKTTNNYK